MPEEKNIKGAKGDYLQRKRPGRLTGRDFSPQDFPFDAWEFREYDKDDGNPKLTLKDDWILDPDAIQAYSMTVKQITAPASTPQIDGGTDVGSADAATYDGGESPNISADSIYNDNSGENDISGITSDAVVMESPVFFKEGIAGDVQSLDFSAGSSGWKIEKSGDVEFNNGVFRGQLSGATGTFSGQLSAASGTFTGEITATTGTFYETVSVRSSGDFGSLNTRIGSVWTSSEFPRTAQNTIYNYLRDRLTAGPEFSLNKLGVLGFVYVGGSNYALGHIEYDVVNSRYDIYDVGGTKRTEVADTTSVWIGGATSGGQLYFAFFYAYD